MIVEVCLEEQALANIFSCEKDWKEYNHLVFLINWGAVDLSCHNNIRFLDFQD